MGGGVIRIFLTWKNAGIDYARRRLGERFPWNAVVYMYELMGDECGLRKSAGKKHTETDRCNTSGGITTWVMRSTTATVTGCA